MIVDSRSLKMYGGESDDGGLRSAMREYESSIRVTYYTFLNESRMDSSVKSLQSETIIFSNCVI